MQEAETVLSIIGNLPPESDHWRARYGETRSAGSGRGRRKRTRIAGTSPAAYFTRGGILTMLRPSEVKMASNASVNLASRSRIRRKRRDKRAWRRRWKSSTSKG
jgi:hypothetical protein